MLHGRGRGRGRPGLGRRQGKGTGLGLAERAEICCWARTAPGSQPVAGSRPAGHALRAKNLCRPWPLQITFDLRPHSSETGGHIQATAAAATIEAAAAAAAGAAAEGPATVVLRGRGPAPRQFYTHRVGGAASEAALLQLLLAAGVEFGVVRTSLSAQFSRWVGPARRCLWLGGTRQEGGGAP